MKKLYILVVATVIFLFTQFHVTVLAAPTVTHLTKGVDTDGNSTATTASVSPTGSTLLLMTIASRTGSSTNPNQPTVTGNGITWVAEETTIYDTTSSSRRRETVFRALHSSPSAGAISISFGGQNQSEVRWIVDQIENVDISGTNGSGAVVQSVANQDTSGSGTSLTVTLGTFGSSENSTYGVFADAGTTGGTAGAGFTQVAQTGTLSDTVMVVSEFKSTNDTSVDFTFSTSNEKGGIALEIKAGNSPTNTPTPTPTITLTPTITPTFTPTPTGFINPNRPDKIVMVWEENRQLQQVLGVGYFTQLANDGALFVNSFASFHPSQPNYIEFFAGSNLSVTDNTCPPPGSPFSANNIGKQLIDAGFTFKGYVESLPANTSPCTQLPYAGHHVPWLYFSNIATNLTRNFTEWPSDYTTLPNFSIVIPNNDSNSHDTSVEYASDWLEDTVDGYKTWAMTHNSLLIVHFDEDDGSADNRIYTVFVGPMIEPGIYNETISHKRVLATIEDLYGLSALTTATPITDIFVN